MDLDDALAEMVAHSGDRLHRVAYQLTHDRAAAQDLVPRYYENLPDHQIAALPGCRKASVCSLASRGPAVLPQLACPASERRTGRERH